MNFDKAFDRLLGHEGGFVDHPRPWRRDPVGHYAACRSCLRLRWRHALLPVTDAKRIARTDYWDAVRADEMPDAVRFDLSMRPTTRRGAGDEVVSAGSRRRRRRNHRPENDPRGSHG